MRISHNEIGAAETSDRWMRIGAVCSAGVRSMWMKLELVGDPIHYSKETVASIRLCAGREGDDFEMTLTHANPQFGELLDLFLTAHFAAST